MCRPKHGYTKPELCREYLRDLIVDVRCAERDGLPDYAKACREKIRALWPTRHTPRINRYGEPLA